MVGLGISEPSKRITPFGVSVPPYKKRAEAFAASELGQSCRGNSEGTREGNSRNSDKLFICTPKFGEKDAQF